MTCPTFQSHMFQEIKYGVRRRGARLHELKTTGFVATEVDKMTQFLYVPLMVMGPALFAA